MGRQGWRVSFRSGDFRERPARRTASPESEGKPCARAEWCASADRQRLDDGTTRRTPVVTYRAFCDTDSDLIGRCLASFPDLHGRLAGHVGDFLTTEVLIRVPFGPNVLIRVDIDGLMRHIVDVVMSWHERVADVDPDLTPPDTQRTHARELGIRSGSLLPHSCAVLAERRVALIGLAPGPMMRPQTSWLSSVVPDAVVHGAWRDGLLLGLSGADAGNEILRLDYLGRSALLETIPAPERLLGVPCRSCPGEPRSLRRAAPPQHDGDPEWYSECMICRDLMSPEEYGVWVKRNAAYYVTRVTPAQVAAGLVA
jgi:hypothetical protein